MTLGKLLAGRRTSLWFTWSFGSTNLLTTSLFLRLVHSAATALASMSIAPASTSPAQSHMHTRSRSQAQGELAGVNTFVVNLKSIPVPITGRRAASGALAKSVPTQDLDLGSAIDDDIEVDVEDDDGASVVGGAKDNLPSAKKGKTTGKKRGTIFKCESCSKVSSNSGYLLCSSVLLV